jgi:hypothetical protein
MLTIVERQFVTNVMGGTVGIRQTEHMWRKCQHAITANHIHLC